MSSQAGSVIRAGSRVSALIGELGYWNGPPPEVQANGRRKNKYRERYFGTVIESRPDRKWSVRWDRRGVVSEEGYSTYKLRYEGQGRDLRPTNQEAAQQRSQAVATARQQQQVRQETATAAPPQQAATTTTTTEQVAVETVEETIQEAEVETVEETIVAQAAVEDVNARTLDPDVVEEEDDRFDVENDFELYDPDDIAEYEGDRHARKWTSYELAKAALQDDEVSVGAGARKITWKVRGDIKASDVDPEFPDVGICDFDFTAHPSEKTMNTRGWKNPKKYKKQKRRRVNFLDLLIHLWPGNWEDQLQRMNNRVEAMNVEQSQTKRNAGQRYKKVKEITKSEFWVFFGLMVSARIHGRQGQLWDNEDVEPEGVEQPVNLGHHMLKYRFDNIKKFVPYMWERPELKETDPWWQISLMEKQFNENRKNKVMSSFEKVLDELMSAFRPQTRKTGDLPNLSFIPRKPEPLGAEFKCICCAITGIMIWIELQRGKDGMRAAEYSAASGVTAACTMRGARDSKYCVGDDEDDTNEMFFGDSWFSSVETVCQLWNRFKCHYGGILKTNHSRFPKAWIEETMKDWPAGSHIVLEGQATREGVGLIAIGYKYNSRKSLCFISHKDAGATECTDFYEAKWKDRNGNTESRRVPRPDVMGRYFRVCNRVDMHNHARQSLLALEKHWVMMTGYFWMITTILGMCITDAWKGYRHHLNKQHRHKDMDMKDFASALAYDMLHNDFDNLVAADRVLVIDSRVRGELRGVEQQSMVSSLDMSSERGAVAETARMVSTSGASLELLAIANRETVVAKHGELELVLGTEKSKASPRGKRKRCSISGCAKKSRWQCKVCGDALCHTGDCVSIHQGRVREEMKEEE
jgi:hypothetical protein